MREPGLAQIVLPETLASAVRIELGRAFSPPYEALSVVIANGLLMTGAWFLLPPNWLFRFHGALAFPMILASWMYSDVPATNVLGSDPWRSIAAIETGALRRVLFAKNLALWLLVVPVCVAVAIGIGISEDRLTATLVSSLWIAVVPLGALCASSISDSELVHGTRARGVPEGRRPGVAERGLRR